MSVVKTTVRNGDRSGLEQHWTANSLAELEEAYRDEQVIYPFSMFGTMLYGMRADPTGLLYHATFWRSRNASIA